MTLHSIYTQKNQQLFFDEIDNSSISSQHTPNFNIVNAFFVKHITHIYDDVSHLYMFSYIYYRNNNCRKININDLCDNDFKKFMESTVINNNNTYSSTVPKLLKYKNMYINVYYVASKTYVASKKNRKKDNVKPLYNGNSNVLIDYLQFDDIIAGEMNDDNNIITSDSVNNIIEILNNCERNKLRNFNVSYTQTIKYPVHYVNGVDTLSVNTPHCNTFHVYVDCEKITKKLEETLYTKSGRNAFNFTMKKSEINRKICDILFGTAMCIFYINTSNKLELNDLNNLHIFYLEILILKNWYFNRHIQINNLTFQKLFRHTTKKIESIAINGYYNFINGVRNLYAVSSVNQCLYPHDMMKDEKKKWKEEHGIVRQKSCRKTKYGKKTVNHVIKLHNSGMSLREIGKKLKLSKDTVAKILRENSPASSKTEI